jgi:hypothetical protein
MPGCPEGLKEAFAGALALNPAQRLDAAGLLDALELAEEELREEQIVQMEKARAAELATARRGGASDARGGAGDRRRGGSPDARVRTAATASTLRHGPLAGEGWLRGSRARRH